MSSYINRPPAPTTPSALLLRVQRLHDANICWRQTLRVQLNEHEHLIAVIEETYSSIEDVSGWFKQTRELSARH